MSRTVTLNKKIRGLGINAIAKASGLNKSTISRYVNGQREYSFENFGKVEAAVNRLLKNELRGRTSVFEATRRVLEGEDWRIPYFDFVDSFLATRNELLWADRPVDGLDLRSLALICSIVMQLADEMKVPAPEWAKMSLALDEPWFVSKFKSLRAISLVESPVFFKRNNIFVGDDFLKRA